MEKFMLLATLFFDRPLTEEKPLAPFEVEGIDYVETTAFSTATFQIPLAVVVDKATAETYAAAFDVKGNLKQDEWFGLMLSQLIPKETLDFVKSHYRLLTGVVGKITPL